MNNSYQTRFSALFRILALCAITCALSANAFAQNTPGGTVISNRATATYSDGGGNNFSTDSNTVTVTVANVSGIAITPDAGTRPTVVAGQTTGTLFTFAVNNTGNFSDQVRFLANGQSIQVAGPATVAAAVIDVDNSGTINAGDTNIFANGADVLSAAIARNASIQVLVRISVNAGAQNGNTITVTLGDAATGSPTYDNQTPDNPATPSTHEVRTVSTTSVNGVREARGDISTTVENDAQLLLTMTAPTGPVPLGSDLTYSLTVNNPGARAAQASVDVNGNGTVDPGEAITLNGANGIYVVAPIPAGTALKSGQTFPAGTLYTTTALTTAPLAATWTTTAPANLTQVTRIAFNVGTSIAVGATTTAVSFQVTITTNDATTPIAEIADVFAKNSIGATITDQSGDASTNAGDSNANFNEGAQPGSVDANGVIQYTTLQQQGGVLLGPLGQPGAVGPTNTNDDYTNKSVTAGIAGVAPGEFTTAGSAVIFTNTVQNTGNANDTFIITVPVAPANFTIEVSINGGVLYTPLQAGNGSSVSLPVLFGQSAPVLVRITAPSGLLALQPYAVTMRASSTNTPASTNNTINRLYTGFLQLGKTASVVENNTGNGGPNDYVPGAVIEYVITYANVSSTGGTNNSQLTASNIVITENGNAAPNNWGTTTDHVVGATDSGSGVIVGDVVGSTLLTDTVTSLAPGQSGTFRFRRRIK